MDHDEPEQLKDGKHAQKRDLKQLKLGEDQIKAKIQSETKSKIDQNRACTEKAMGTVIPETID